MKTFYIAAVALMFALMGCGGGRPVIVQPAMGQVIYSGNGQNQALFQVVTDSGDQDIQISFVPANVPGISCQAYSGTAVCYSTGGGFFQEKELFIVAQRGDNKEFSYVILRPGSGS